MNRIQHHLSTGLFILCGALLVGCAGYRTAFVAPVDTGYSVRVNTSFDSLPNYTRVYFQHGGRVAYQSLDRSITYCSLYVYNRDKQADYLSSVASGSFAISDVKTHEKSSDQIPGSSGLYASVGIGVTLASGKDSDWERDGRPSYYLYEVEMKLSSAEQPDVKSLSCAKKWSVRGNYYPTLAEMRRALGDLVTLQAVDA